MADLNRKMLLDALQNCTAAERALLDVLKHSTAEQKVVPKGCDSLPVSNACDFCGFFGHGILDCRKMKFYRSQMRKEKRNNIHK